MKEPFGPDSRDADRFILDPVYDVTPTAPYAATIARLRATLGSIESAKALLAKWESIDLGEPGSSRPFPWWPTFFHLDPPPYAPNPKSWPPWRADDARLDLQPHRFEERFLSPIVHAECAESLLEWQGAGEDQLRVPARSLWQKLEPRLGYEFSGHVPAGNPWLDSLALWCLVNRPGLLGAMQPLAFAIATRLAAFARRHEGRVTGRGFPFNGKYLVSATAQLATSLLVIGQDLDLAAQLVGAVSAARTADGSWADQDNPPDILTTLVAADLMLHVDPVFDPAPTRAFFLSKRNARGTWTAFGPEEPWVTWEILQWEKRSRLPFPERFRWPQVSLPNLDRKLSIPNYAWYEQVADLFSSIPPLSGQSTTLAFVDLAGFGKFNNRFGQETGDAVLRKFSAHLAASIPGGRPCRDGGDEFLVIGTPASSRLPDDLDGMRASWPGVFHKAFGADVPSVAPRIVVVPCRCGELRAARRCLGRSIAALKEAHPTPPEQGVVLRLDRVEG
jgi:GGDEF domain-containing protein